MNWTFVIVFCCCVSPIFGWTTYGDIRKLRPTGCSAATAKQDKLPYAGVKGSQKILENDYATLTKLRTCYHSVGRKYGLHASVIAGLASRESRGGSVIVRTNGWGDCRNPKDISTCRAYGILQCDIHSSGLGQECKKYYWSSCEHIDMMITRVFLDKVRGVQRKFPKWLKERQLQGGIAAYNFGVSNVRTWERLDIGTTGNDYSNDVVARAQHLINKYGWN